MKKLIVVVIAITLLISTAVPVAADYAAVEKPPAVQELKVMKNGYKSLKLTWNAVDNADQYQVYRSKTGKTGSFALIKTTTGTIYTNTGITCGKTYWYKVRAVNVAGKGTFSVVKSNKVQPATAKIISVPLGGKDSAPYDHAPKPTWNKVAGATGYQIYRTIEGKNNWKRIATTKRIYYLDNFDAGFRSWKNYEYKVRAYRAVNGKKVYGYFSKAGKYVPDWNMDELMPELIAYGESIKGQRLEFVGFDTNDEPINKVYTGPEGDTYTMTHITTDDGIERTPENSSWTALFPETIGHYWKKNTVKKELKECVKWAIDDQMEANQLVFVPADGKTPAYWAGVDIFTLYTRKSGNDFLFWVMF